MRQQTTDGRSFLIEVSATLPMTHGLLLCGEVQGGVCNGIVSADVVWSWNSTVKSRSSLACGLFEHGVYRGNLAALWAEPRTMSPIEIETVEAACALVELAAKPLHTML
jgi:hypothetical protein